MSFVEETYQVIALYAQNELWAVEPGNEAEFALTTYPGRIIKATVDSIVWAQGQGQVAQSGVLPQTGAFPQVPGRFPVKLNVAERDRDLFLAAGAEGHGAIYTEHVACHPHHAHGDPAHRRDHRLPRAEAALMRATSHPSWMLAAAARGRAGGLRAQSAADDGRAAQGRAAAHGRSPRRGRPRGGAAAPVADRWLATFNDPALSALVTEALAYNADLQVAAARVEQAAGYVEVASGSIYPSVGLAATQSGKSGGGGGLNAVFLNASLELDVWGRIRYGTAAAEAQSAAVQADYAYARQSLAAMVAKSWFVAIEAGLQRAIVVDALNSSESLLKLVAGAVARSATATSRRWRKRAPTPAPIVTRCARSSCRASRRCARSNCCSDATPRRRSR